MVKIPKNQAGFITEIVVLLLMLFAAIIFVYLRVLKAQ